MSRENALSIFINDSDKDKLSEIYGQVIESVQKDAISEQIKNKNYSGEPESGSVEINRFKNSTVSNLGTARNNGYGDKLINSGKVTINVDTDKEIVEEVSLKDIKLHGVSGMAEKRKLNHVKKMTSYLDKSFFDCAVSEGSSYDLSADNLTIVEQLEELIVDVETTQNDWVDGVDRDMLVLTVKPSVYSQLRNYIDTVPNSLTSLTENYFHEVKIYSNHRQSVDAICMIDGAIAQLVTTNEYDAEKIPLSNDVAIELFFSKGTKAVMPDLIKYFGEQASI